MKKILALILAVLMVGSLAACGGTSDDTIRVGVVQLIQHEALDAATQGFVDTLKAEFGDKVVIDVQNASGEATNCTTIVNGFVSSNVDLIMANATAALQAAREGTGTIPVLGTSITDYASALKIENWNGTVGGNVSGTTDLAPLDQQAAIFTELFPDKKNVGMLYCSAEANSQYQVNEMTKLLEGLGYTVTPFAFTDTTNVTSVAQAACDASDVIYIPTDNTAANNTEAIANVVIPAKVPVIAGEQGICKGCGVATLSIDYYDLGVATGKMAVKILKGEANIAEMPVEAAAGAVKMYNKTNCEALGLTIPDTYTVIE